MHILESFLKTREVTQAAFAKAIGKVDGDGNGRQSYVSMLLHRLKQGRPVPADICPKIEEATGGEITRHDLRPDIFGTPPAAKKRARAA